ncbi:MAG: formyltransferase family protein [SAR86 cluster bacterium]|jgi:folate-dependent phosphoribosylglycinamide formyltransferase PurN|nr:formyltransferase family protein [SAR86 cluster bacterium]
MRITVFTSNQARHISLIENLANICDELYCVQECNTIFPGSVEDFYKKTDIMQEYFGSVLNAEKKIFGKPSFLQKNIVSFSIKVGDLSLLDKESLSKCLQSDIYIVFGASYIKGWLAEYLTSKNTINIHMGVSPYYRGSSCNFWALYDENPSYVGATIHKLSKGLDNGPILYHCLPKYKGESVFEFTMNSVKIAHQSLIERISSEEIFDIKPIEQDRSLEVRYTKNMDFTDKVASEFLQRAIILDKTSFNYPDLVNPYFG